MTRLVGDLFGTVLDVRVPGPDGPEVVRVVLNRDGEGAGVLREVFVHGARGDRATVNGLCRLLSLALQRDEPVADLVRMLGRQASGFAPVAWPGGGFCTSLPDALARLLEREAGIAASRALGAGLAAACVGGLTNVRGHGPQGERA